VIVLNWAVMRLELNPTQKPLRTPEICQWKKGLLQTLIKTESMEEWQKLSKERCKKPVNG